jgi:F-type H+-transporting ATPase subunit a
MFADVLHLKHNHEVQNFQELFIKVHGLLLFVLVANVQGMVPYTATITSSLVNTFFLASAVFINILIIMIKEKGITHFLSLFLPSGCPFPLMFLLVPIEFISYVFRVVSLSVRLFANMMAGHTLLKVIVGFS